MLNYFQTCFKGFKLKKIIVEPKMAQPIGESTQLVEFDEELVNLFSSTDRRM